MSLAMWLRNGRAQRNLSLDDVARITKIQPRILERLEGGRLDGLPAEVFVRGFVKSFARCVGLDEDEALRRYTACAVPGQASGVSAARAMVEAMGDLAPNTRGKAPKVLKEEPPQLAAGSMEIAPAAIEEPVNIELIDPAQVQAQTQIDEPISVEATATTAAPTVEVEVEVDAAAVVTAPPADMDLSAEIVIPAELTTKPKAKRTRKPADPNAPKRRRGKAAGSLSEATAIVSASPVTNPVPAIDATEIVAAEIVAEGSEAMSAATVAAAPKRRRKAKGSIVPPIAEAIESVVPAIDLTAIPAIQAPIEAAPVELVPEVSIEIDTRESVVIDAISAADDMFAPISSTQREAERVDAEASSTAVDLAAGDGGDQDPAAEPFASAIEFASISIPSQHSFDAGDAFADQSTTRFEREDLDEVVVSTPSWTPRMPPFASTLGVSTSATWRRAAAAPSLVAVIDDADPEGAERVLEERRRTPARRTFLPPILLDRDGDRSARQGGLTLAVIILLIAATLTLSYLMRRPSSAGDGVTSAGTPASSIG